MTTPFKNLLGFALLLALPLGFVACDDDDVMDPVTPPAPTTIASVASGDDRFETLVSSLAAADLVTTLSGDGPFTVFAPTDDAFAAIDLAPFTDEQVKNVLLYHVLIGAEVPSANIETGVTTLDIPNTLGFGGNQVASFIVNDANGIRVNRATVIDADIEADNGVIHAIDQVLLPPTVVDLAITLPTTSSLVSALQSADASPDYDLVNTLSGAGPFTVFAPTNDVFMVPGTPTASEIGAVLAYHVIPGNVRAADLPDGMTQMVATVNGAMLSITRNGDAVTLVDGQGNTFNVTAANIQGANGVIHTIDGVMMP